ncbi:MAG: hypothetical protein AMJ42_00985 [Deltaproteobacteria bacterium DG_8]|nr:MAG: hypothetical protein AMJ42_00985 [Deltaproteobacteria bacterium DG_8]
MGRRAGGQAIRFEISRLLNRVKKASSRFSNRVYLDIDALLISGILIENMLLKSKKIIPIINF